MIRHRYDRVDLTIMWGLGVAIGMVLGLLLGGTIP